MKKRKINTWEEAVLYFKKHNLSLGAVLVPSEMYRKWMKAGHLCSLTKPYTYKGTPVLEDEYEQLEKDEVVLLSDKMFSGALASFELIE